MKNIVIKNLKRWVLSYNTFLSDTIDTMDVLTLLRNVHPYVRVDFAYQCLDNGLITRAELYEFIKKK